MIINGMFDPSRILIPERIATPSAINITYRTPVIDYYS
jgi:hypothetical protein